MTYYLIHDAVSYHDDLLKTIRMSPLTKTVLLLILSNVFMTMAWYGHLKFLEHRALWMVIGISWLIALPEYCFQVPANRLGHTNGIRAPELKIIQEVISITVFVLFNALVLRDQVRPSDWLAFGLILLAVVVFCLPRIWGVEQGT